MKIIAGLGNPGLKYKTTRHNVGFLAIDKIASHSEVSPVGENLHFIQNHTFNAQVASTQVNGEKIFLIKPQTFMNDSGQAISKIMQYFKVDISDLIVLLDEVDIPLGQIRIRLEGSSAGHKGLQNIIDILGTDQFVRVRIGIAEEIKNLQEIDQKNDLIDTKDYVLESFSKRELPILEQVIERTANEVISRLGSKVPLKATTIEIV